MPNIFQIRTVLTGFTGAPGYNQMYFDASGGTPGAQAASDLVQAFWNAVCQDCNNGFKFTIDADVHVLDDSTGVLQSITPTTPLAQSTFPSGSGYAGGVGSCISWLTGAVHGTHQLRGRTFVVPLNSGSYDTDGSLTSTALNRARTAATALVASGEFGVWGRPVAGANGLWSQALASNVRDKIAVLRSRRD